MVQDFRKLNAKKKEVTVSCGYVIAFGALVAPLRKGTARSAACNTKVFMTYFLLPLCIKVNKTFLGKELLKKLLL